MDPQYLTPLVNGRVHYCPKRETTISHFLVSAARRLLSERSEPRIHDAQCTATNGTQSTSKSIRASPLRPEIQHQATWHGVTQTCSVIHAQMRMRPVQSSMHNCEWDLFSHPYTNEDETCLVIHAQLQMNLFSYPCTTANEICLVIYAQLRMRPVQSTMHKWRRNLFSHLCTTADETCSVIHAHMRTRPVQSSMHKCGWDLFSQPCTNEDETCLVIYAQLRMRPVQ